MTRTILRFASLGLTVAAVAACDPDTRDPMGPGGPGISLEPDSPEPWLPPADADLSPEPGMELYCAQETAVVDPRPADVMLVLDKSRSMLSRWDHDGDPATPTVTRWSSLHGVVTDVVTQFEDRLSLGAVLFPAADVDSSASDIACRVEDTPDALPRLTGGQELLAALPPADTDDIWGATPARVAIATAVDDLLQIADGRPQAIVLVTDGAANCSEGSTGSDVFGVYDEELEVAVAEAFEAGIGVYVVGIDIVDDQVTNPAVNPFDALSNVALAGGVPDDGDVPFYDALDEGSLAAALDEIAESLGCTVAADVDGPTALLNVGIDGAFMPAVDSCEDDPGGWSRVDGPGTRIELCAQACTSFSEGAALEVAYDCYPEE